MNIETKPSAQMLRGIFRSGKVEVVAEVMD